MVFKGEHTEGELGVGAPGEGVALRNGFDACLRGIKAQGFGNGRFVGFDKGELRAVRGEPEGVLTVHFLRGDKVRQAHHDAVRCLFREALDRSLGGPQPKVPVVHVGKTVIAGGAGELMYLMAVRTQALRTGPFQGLLIGDPVEGEA